MDSASRSPRNSRERAAKAAAARAEFQQHLPEIEQAAYASGRLGGGTYVGFRSPALLKTRLEEAAKSSGRSLSTEAQIRLQQTFRDEDALSSALELAFGNAGGALVRQLGRALANACARHYPVVDDGWLDDSLAYDAAVTAVTALLEALRPAGPRLGLTLKAIAEDDATRGLEDLLDAVGPEVRHRLLAWRERLWEVETTPSTLQTDTKKAD